MKLLVGRSFQDLGPNSPGAKRRKLLETMNDVLPKLSAFNGQFVAITLSGFWVAPDRDLANAMTKDHVPRVVIHIESKPPQEDT